MKLLHVLSIAGTIGLSVLSPASADAAAPLYGQRTSLFEILPVDSTNIVFLGNSLTHNCEWHELLDNHKVLNRGISSDVAEGIYDRLDPILAGKPAKIFLMVGINDISHDLTPQQITALTERIVDRILTQSPGTQLYLQSVLPVNESFGVYKGIIGKTAVVTQVNSLYREMAKSKGIPYIDLYSLFADENGSMRPEYTNDGLHLTAPGYLLWKKALQPYIK